VTLVLSFHADLNDDMSGFYRSQYTGNVIIPIRYQLLENNKTWWIATTDFEPINARRAFIAYDEPALKATFAITLIIPANWTAISNMPENNTVTHAGKQVKKRSENILKFFSGGAFSEVSQDEYLLGLLRCITILVCGR
jgi:aminopeptidase N